MGFPNKKQLDKVRARLEKAEGTLMIAPDATPLEKLRWDICQKFIQYKAEHDMTQDELAEAIGVDKAKVSKMGNHSLGIVGNIANTCTALPCW